MSEKTTRWIFLAFATVGAYYLFTDHRAYVLDYLPYVLLIACPLMHFFAHHRKHYEQKGPSLDC